MALPNEPVGAAGQGGSGRWGATSRSGSAPGREFVTASVDQPQLGPTVKRAEHDRRLGKMLDDQPDPIGVMDADDESVLDGVLESLPGAPVQES
ncbi:hypothetical protein [Lacipirellula limnantheis]|uniref:hypothetical protein n=1 Tax=Lacipirellula limnantheis TaxID=2528024 RepID=UPI0011AAF0B8|nr:hypothetical protein [Lacipirellula limnantheis]